MPGIRESIFRELLYHEQAAKSALCDRCSLDQDRAAGILADLERNGYLAAAYPETGDERTLRRYSIRHDPEVIYRVWLENPDLRIDMQKTPWVLDILARERLRVSDDELRAEVREMLGESGLFFELALKNRRIAEIVANWDRLLSDPDFSLENEGLLAEDEILPAYTYHSFFGFCVFYDCLTTGDPGERIRFLRSVQENNPTLMAVTKIIDLLK